MIFAHTLEQVLSKQKCQTSRLWKDDYTFSCDEYDRELPSVILSMKAFDAGKIRRLYQVGQFLSVQPARGQKGVAKIRILELTKRDVRNFKLEDYVNEGLGLTEFMDVWTQMHDKSHYATRFFDKTDIQEFRHKYSEWIIETMKRPAEFYEALVIRFELVQEKQS